MKTKMIPPILMLSAGAVCSIVMSLSHYDLKTLLTILLAVLVVFYIAGLCIKKLIDTFTLANQAKAAEEGEVIEKETEDTGEAEGESGQTEE